MIYNTYNGCQLVVNKKEKRRFDTKKLIIYSKCCLYYLNFNILADDYKLFRDL